MTTRATYKLIEPSGASIEVYIHTDGYKKGASMYFQKAIREMQESGAGFITSFIRANEDADAVISELLDTEYHYDMTDEEVKLYEIDIDKRKIKSMEVFTAKEFSALYEMREEKL